MNGRVLRRRAVTITSMLAGFAVFGMPAHAGGPLPYEDSDAIGSVGFCDTAGHEVTKGSLGATPFAAYAVSDYRPPADYDVRGTGAFLIAYQPREGTQPKEWSGEQITASSTYSNPSFPKLEILPQDITLEQIAGDYPPRWDGLLELRIYVKAPNHPAYSEHYGAADIRVTGDSWELVKGGGVSCTETGSAQSAARILYHDGPTSSSPPASDGRTSMPARATPRSAGPVASAGAPSSSGPRNASSTRPGSSSSSAWLLPAIVAGVALVGVASAGTYQWRRRSIGRARQG